MKLRTIVEIIKDWNIIKTFKYNFNKKQQGLFVIRKGAGIDIHESAKIIIKNGQLDFNKKWENKDPFCSHLIMQENSQLIVEGSMSIYTGARISINKNAVLTFGSGYVNHNVNIACFDKISIGNHVYISENVTIRDSDDHKIISNKNHITTSPIVIEDDVWIGLNVVILKGVKIGKGAVVAAGALVVKDVAPNTLVGGIPARVIRDNITWE